MNTYKWTIRSSEQVFETTSKGLRVQRRVYECEDGRLKTVELKDEGPFGHAFAVTPDNKVILIRQFRVGPDKYYFESPAGSLSKEGNPEEEVMRELREETGYTAGKVIHLRTSHDGAYTTAVRHMYLALDCTKTHDQELDSDEYIDHVQLSSMSDVQEMIKNDEYSYPYLAYLAFEKLGYLQLHFPS
jgi:ADP-ribose pyrophosphatase